MNKVVPPLVIYVTREGLSICSPEGQTPAQIKFGRDLVSDLEVVNPAQLSAEIKKFLETKKIKPGNLVLVLSESIYFEHNYAKPSPPTDQEMENFADTVPFSAVSSKVIPFGGGFRQIVINRDHYETILKTLEQLQFKIAGVIPAFVLGISGQEVTAEHCRTIFHKLDQALVSGSLLTTANDRSFEKKEQVFMEKNKLLIVIFTVVFVLMAAVTAYFTLKPPAKKDRTTNSSTTISRVMPTPVPQTDTESSTPSAEILRSLSVRVVNASGLVGRAASVSAVLSEAGFVSVQATNANSRLTETSLVASPFAATAAGEYITRLLSPLYPDIEIASDSAAKIDLVITIGTR